MKVKVTSQKGLKTSLSVVVDKAIIQKKLDDKLLECWIESENPSLRIGEIHYARVTQVEKLVNR